MRWKRNDFVARDAIEERGRENVCIFGAGRFCLRAFLMNNSRYSIQFFGEMLMRLHSEKLNEKLSDIHGSLWIRKE